MARSLGEKRVESEHGNWQGGSEMVPIIEFCASTIGLILLGLQVSLAVLMIVARILVRFGLLRAEGDKRGLSGFLWNFS
jgi:hypothetical protein